MKMDGLAIIRFFWVWPNFKQRYYYFTSDYNIAAVVILVGLLHCSLLAGDNWEKNYNYNQVLCWQETYHIDFLSCKLQWHG